MVKECMAIVTNMTEAQSNVLAKNLNLSELDCLNSKLRHADEPPRCLSTEQETLGDFKSANVVNIDGIMLPIYDKTNANKGNLVPVKSTVDNLRSLALAVASGMLYIIVNIPYTTHPFTLEICRDNSPPCAKIMLIRICGDI